MRSVMVECEIIDFCSKLNPSIPFDASRPDDEVPMKSTWGSNFIHKYLTFHYEVGSLSSDFQRGLQHAN